MSRATRARLIHAISTQRILKLTIFIAVLNMVVLSLSLINAIPGAGYHPAPIMVSWGWLSLMAFPLVMMAFRSWAIVRGWSMVYAQDVAWLDIVAGKVTEAHVLELMRMPLLVQQRLADAMMKHGWLTWADVRDCAAEAGLPLITSTLLTVQAHRPANHRRATRSDLKTVISQDVWEHASMSRYTGAPAQGKAVPLSRF